MHGDATTEAGDVHAPGRLDYAVRPWTARTLQPSQWRLGITAAVLAELDAVLAGPEYGAAPIEDLDPPAAALPAVRSLMAEVRRRLDTGAGVVVLDGLSVDRHDKRQLKAIYWVLSRQLARPMPQSRDGTLLHDVMDTGRTMNERVRGDLTSQEILWHSDNGFAVPPRYFGLAVLRTAKSGGDSRIANLVSAHQVLQARAPDLLERLHRPFAWRRIGDYADHEAVADYPVYRWADGALECRLNRRVIEAGYAARGSAIDATGRAALDLLYDILDEPGFAFEYQLEPGQIQWVNNLSLVHHRTSFVDWDEPDRRRHLVRIYLRDRDPRAGLE
ncbi:MAG: TauD/TfdA family dioxygenase [Lautropia sp.]